jgi:uroporphyrinogen decarboxylase
VSRLTNDTFLRALMREPTEYTPVWLMRQAGRYLPEYCETRKRAGSFLDLCKNKALACEVTLQPLARYDLDAAILFSDILTVPDAIRRALDGSVPLIGFSGSPWTLACYMVEGGSSSDYRKVKSLAYSRPDLMHHILDVTTQAVIVYLNAQIESGAQAAMVFDSWGGVLSEAAYHEFSLPYLKRVVDGLIRENDGRRVPNIVFTKGGGLWLEDIASIGSDGVGLDWTMDIGRARKLVGDRVALQGNLDPNVLFAPPEVVAAETRKIIDAYGPHPGHIFNLGHGISQFTPPESVSVLVDTAHEHSRIVRAGA